jgi:GTP-binding protein
LVDGTDEDIAGAYTTVRSELAQYGAGLSGKFEIPVLSKCDALNERQLEDRAHRLAEAAGCTPDGVMRISGVTGTGVEALMRAALAHVQAARRARIEEAVEGRQVAP